MVEAKFHNQPGFRTDLKTALYVKARFDDVKKAGFNKCWLTTNTKFSRDAVKYSGCAGVELLGWNWPKGKGVETLIAETELYPITVITILSSAEKKLLLDNNVVVCRDIVENPRILNEVGIDKGKSQRVTEEARKIIGGK